MGKQSNGRLMAYLPLVLTATFAVVVAPMLVVFWLRQSEIVGSPWIGTAIGVALTLGISQAGAALWKAKADSELLFSELMLWGWVQRWRNERRLTAAADLLGLTEGKPKPISGGALTNEQKSSLLTQLTTSLEARDHYTHGHSRRVARHAANIAKRMGLSRAEVTKIRAAGAMHDVGKVETPIPVLHKEGKLSDEEYAIVKRHPVDGARMVAMLDDEELTAIVRHHHERLDGTGYPDGLAGDAIPLGARILAVADTFDAITSTRPYRHANPHKKGLAILAAEAGTQLDPDAVRAFHDCYSGRKPLAGWTILVNARPRLSSLLAGGLSPTNAASVMSTAATAAAVGVAGAATGAPLATNPAAPVRPAAYVGAAPRATADRTPSRGLLPRTGVMASLDAPQHVDGGGQVGESTKPAGRGDPAVGTEDVQAVGDQTSGGPVSVDSESPGAVANPITPPASPKAVSHPPASGKDRRKGQSGKRGNGGGQIKGGGRDKPGAKGQGNGKAKGHSKAKGPANAKGDGNAKRKADAKVKDKGNRDGNAERKADAKVKGNGNRDGNPNGTGQGGGKDHVEKVGKQDRTDRS